MTDIQKVTIVGLGGMGAMFAALFVNGGFDVNVLAEGDRAERIERDGFYVDARHYQLPVIRPTDDTQPADLVFVSVKDHHLPDVIDDMRVVDGLDTLFLSVVNGLDSEPILAGRFGEHKVPICISIATAPIRDGNRTVVTTWGKLIYGDATNIPPFSERIQRINAAFDRAGIVYENPADMLHMMWYKFMVNVGANQVSAILGATYGQLRQSIYARAMMRLLMREVIELAQAKNIRLSDVDLKRWDDVLKGLDADGKTSMLQDVEAGRETEVDIFAGKVVRLGQELGIETPYNRVFYDLLATQDNIASATDEICGIGERLASLVERSVSRTG